MNDPRPAHMQWLTPLLMVKDAQSSMNFYAAAFGFSVREQRGEDNGPIFVSMEHHGELVLMFSQEGAFGAPEKSPASMGVMASQAFYLYVDEVDQTYLNALEAGAKNLIAPSNMFWGDRFAMVEDNDGYRWALARRFSFGV